MPKKIVGFLSAFVALDITAAVAAAEDIEYFSGRDECENSWLYTELMDECWACMYGENNEIYEIDGCLDDSCSMRYAYDNSNESTWCEIKDGYERYIACAEGYYGFPWQADDIALRGCDRCPGGGTSDAIAGQEKTITDCYIASGSVQKDTSGTYVYTNDCHYTK